MAFLTALTFLTVLPLPAPRVDEDVLGRAVGYFPLVGLLLGGVLAGVAWGSARVFPPQMTAVLILTVWLILTGALHLDGFLDACDGLLGGHTPEDRLSIMRDERVGAFALAGGVLLLLAKYTALTVWLETARPLPGPWPGHPLPPQLALILPPTLARFAMSVALLAFPYARDKGLGKVLKDHVRPRDGVFAGATALLLSLLLLRGRGFLLWMGVLGLTWGCARWVMRRIPGLTGDVYGALCELGETLVLWMLVV